MEWTQTMRKMIDLNKMAFDCSFNTITALQDQTEKTMGEWMDACPWITDKGREAADKWAEACKQNRETFKANLDEAHQKMSAMFISKPQETE